MQASLSQSHGFFMGEGDLMIPNYDDEPVGCKRPS